MKINYVTTTDELAKELQELLTNIPLTLNVNGKEFMDDFELQILINKEKDTALINLELSSSVKIVDNYTSLKEFRQSQNISPKDMAKILKVSDTHYCHLESGEKYPSYQVMAEFKKEFPEACIDEVFFGGIK